VPRNCIGGRWKKGTNSLLFRGTPPLCMLGVSFGYRWRRIVRRTVGAFGKRPRGKKTIVFGPVKTEVRVWGTAESKEFSKTVKED